MNWLDGNIQEIVKVILRYTVKFIEKNSIYFRIMSSRECPHCGEILTRQSYYTHRQLFFRNGIWKKKNTLSMYYHLHYIELFHFLTTQWVVKLFRVAVFYEKK